MTTHIGLVDAVDRIEPGLVDRTIRRGHDTLRAGRHRAAADRGLRHQPARRRERPVRARRGGARRSRPAIEQARAEGIDARGPLPADTLFFRAGRGDFDLVVAMYHDQGHGPVKVLGPRGRA